MKVNYGINQRREGRWVHENHSLELPQYADDRWDDDFDGDVHREIRRAINEAHPGWLITGYAIVRPRPEPIPIRRSQLRCPHGVQKTRPCDDCAAEGLFPDAVHEDSPSLDDTTYNHADPRNR